MTDNVTPLHSGIRAPTSEPNSALVKVLRDALELAESGMLQSFIGTGWLADGNRVSTVADFHDNVYAMLGAIEMLKQEYLARHADTAK